MGSWNKSYEFPHGEKVVDPVLTGKPFNDAYRYMDWLLTVPLLLLEIIFCMNLDPAEMSTEAWSLGISSALMIAVGYPGELVITGDLSFPIPWSKWCEGGGGHSARLLRIGRNLQMRCGLPHLQYHHQKVGGHYGGRLSPEVKIDLHSSARMQYFWLG